MKVTFRFFTGAKLQPAGTDNDPVKLSLTNHSWKGEQKTDTDSRPLFRLFSSSLILKFTNVYCLYMVYTFPVRLLTDGKG